MTRAVWSDSDSVYRVVETLGYGDQGSRTIIHGPYGTIGAARAQATRLEKENRLYKHYETLTTRVESARTDWEPTK